jgi:hypothetical protein
MPDRIESALRRPDAPWPATPGAYRRVLRRRARRTRALVSGAALALVALLALGAAGMRSLAGGPAPAPAAPPVTADPLTDRLPAFLSNPERDRPLGPVRLAARTGPPEPEWVVMAQRVEPDTTHPDNQGADPGPVLCLSTAPTQPSGILDDGLNGGSCGPEELILTDWDFVLTFVAEVDAVENGVYGVVAPEAARVRVSGRCGYRTVEAPVTRGPAAEPPAGYFITRAQPGRGVPDALTALDAGGRVLYRTAVPPPSPGMPGFECARG